METLTKTPYEIFPIRFSFANELSDSEEVSDYTVVCVNANTGVNTKAAIVHSDALSNNIVTLVIKDGSLHQKHKITVRGETSLSNYFEKDLLLIIASDVNAGSFTKQPNDEFSIEVNFSDELESGDIITSIDVSAFDDKGNDATDIVIEGSEISSPLVAVVVIGGNDGQYYILKVKAATNTNYQYEQLIRMYVKEL